MRVRVGSGDGGFGWEEHSEGRRSCSHFWCLLGLEMNQCGKELKKASMHFLILLNMCVGFSALASVKVLMMHVFEYFTFCFQIYINTVLHASYFF